MRSSKYKIIITKNRQQYRYIKALVNKHKIIDCYKNLIIENEKVKFEKQFIRYAPCLFHIELLSPNKFSDVIEWEKDELGRNLEAPDRKGLFIWKMHKWKEPEEFSIYGLKGQYEYEFIYNLIKKTKEYVAMSIIQNMVILDIDQKPLIIILKNIQDANRLYNVILDENFKHVLAFGTMSRPNRKEFYKTAKKMGVPIKMFYTKSTRW